MGGLILNDCSAMGAYQGFDSQTITKSFYKFNYYKMAKKKLVVNIGHLDKAKEAIDEALGLTEIKRPYSIVSASIKDGYCNYVYMVTEGIGVGDKHGVDGSGLIKEELEHAFGRLRVHLAVIDDVYKHSNIEIQDIDKHHADDLTDLYHVTGIKIGGSEENETVILTGTKFITCVGSRIGFSTPRIPIDNLSSYKWHNELKKLIDQIREEVALYKEGKCILPDQEEETHKSKSKRIKQMTIGDEIAARENENHEEDPYEPDPELDMNMESSRV